MKERIRDLRKALNLTQQSFADQLGVRRNTVAQWEIGVNNLSDQVVRSICREFNVSEEWLRTGSGEMFIPKEVDAWDEVVKQRGLTQSDRILIEKFMNLKPASRQAVMEYMKKVVAALNDGTALPGYVSTSIEDTPGQGRTVADAGGQEQAEPDLAAKVSELERQNQELAAKVAAMEEEDALLGLTDVYSASPSVSVGSISPGAKVKK